MKSIPVFLAAVILMCTSGIAQNKGITFKVENLKAPEELYNTKTPEVIYRKLIEQDADLYNGDTLPNPDIPYQIVATGDKNIPLVSYGYHSFLYGMYNAYATHRPFVLSPDIVWLLISQGFAQHMINNADSMRGYFTFPEGKCSLVAKNDAFNIFDPACPWDELFSSFSSQISAFTGKDLLETLTCNFSTSTPVTRLASEITVMKALSPYLEFIMVGTACGIPVITLEGTTDDWQKVYDKAQALRTYGLDWWIDELDPILKEFIRASKGKIDKKFWIDMCKYHEPEDMYGVPDIIDGWIVKFFPYDKEGNRTSLKEITDIGQLPEEIVKVDMQYLLINGSETKSYLLELWAGFDGLEQTASDFTLKPHIGWMVRMKDSENAALRKKFRTASEGEFSYLQLRVAVIPPELLEVPRIDYLYISFINDIIIPDQLASMSIKELVVDGTITDTEISRILRLFPTTDIVINDKYYYVKDR